MNTEGHPISWWIWAIGLATYATLTTNPWLTSMIIAVATVVYLARRGDQPWARVFWLYFGVAAVVVALRVLFRILLGGGTALYGDAHVVLNLPEVPLPDWALGIQFLGPITRESLLAGLYDGLRLAAIIVVVGAANALANPRRLMRHLPAALYEIGTAIVVAVNVLPQLAASLQRVRRAQELRAGETGRVGRFKRLVVPVLEDALDRSMGLAAGMDTRGYGRTGSQTPTQRRTMTTLMILGLCGICMGAYAVLDANVPRWLGWPMMVGGVGAAVAATAFAGIRVQRTVYRADTWTTGDVAVALSGLGAGVIGWLVTHHQVQIAYPGLVEWPQVSLLALAGLGVALLPACWMPLNPTVSAHGRSQDHAPAEPEAVVSA